MTRPHPKHKQRTIKTVLFAESERAARNLSAISSLAQEPTKVLHILMDICCCCPFSSNDVLVCEICAIFFRRCVCMGESQCGCVNAKILLYGKIDFPPCCTRTERTSICRLHSRKTGKFSHETGRARRELRKMPFKMKILSALNMHTVGIFAI